MASRLLVLAWHNVTPTPFFPSAPGAALAGLEGQLRLLRRVATPIGLETGLRALAEGRPLPPRAVALTFDDGYRDNLELALPLLGRLGLPATFYLVPGLLERTARPWWELVAWAFARSRRTVAEWRGRARPTGDSPAAHAAAWEAAEEIKRMDAAARDAELAGLIDALEPVGSPDEVGELFLDAGGARRLAARAAVGSHTMRHPILTAETPGTQRAELAGSRRRLEALLEVPVVTLAYPNGTERDYDAHTLAAAEEAGYRFSVTTREGWNDARTPPHEIRRFMLDPARGPGGLKGILRAPGVVAFARGR